ncbi:hypothetical protein P700755_000950 [Psychroflexus torquis ATCC 700755]|uniref:Uncharacterized protein n=1 Tax=Psychroflexus torquis (strain ATCC 700755 / CIP 106069 / ACAM 623) TaxID=313595 RepID=K4IFS3_PSYTT|nr:hypothetical protein [Psychroflexus torquis]AFU67926.1 hypothetical protein P700755_000950 [Psychroflexus torquis ATCC 700755]
MKNILLVTAFLAASNLFAQQQQDSILANKVIKLEALVNKHQQDIKKISLELDKDYWTYRGVKKETQKKITKQKNSIDSLNQLINASNQKLVQVNDNLDSKIKQTDETVTSNNSKISELDNSLDKNRLYWIIATLATLLLGGLVYWFLGKRIQSSRTDVETQIKNTKTALEEESVKLDNKLVEILETQLKLKEEETKTQPSISTKKTDHSLAIKVADEVVRMQKNIAKMESSTKGIKPLLKGIERIQNNFAANGYEMINHMNKEYDDRMNIDVINFVSEENLSTDSRIISRIIKLQVNFNGILIQRAQVDVSQN